MTPQNGSEQLMSSPAGASRVRRRTIGVTFKRGDIWLITTESYELADGLSIRLLENKGSSDKAAFSSAAQFLVERLESMPIDVVVALVSAWLYDKLKRNRATLTIDRTRLVVDDKRRVRTFIREHIVRQGAEPAPKARRAKSK